MSNTNISMGVGFDVGGSCGQDAFTPLWPPVRPVVAAAGTDRLLLEDGSSDLLLEDNASGLLLE
jgi:hypothetical protein